MSNLSQPPRILFVTPNFTFMPGRPKSSSGCIKACREGFVGFLADLITELFCLGADVCVAQPDYREIFRTFSGNIASDTAVKLPFDRIFFAKDRVFFYSSAPDSKSEAENLKISLAFQREVMNYIIPRVQPDLIHCHNWMTGLIPAMAKQYAIPCIFTFHGLGTAKSTLADIEDMGIDAAVFWQHLFYDRYPVSYEASRENNPPDFLLSGIFSARLANAYNPALMLQKNKGLGELDSLPVRRVLAQKLSAGNAVVRDTHWMRIKDYIAFYEKMLQRPIIRKDRKILKLKDVSENKQLGSIRSHILREKTSLIPNFEVMMA